jgi:hypothetical protein
MRNQQGSTFGRKLFAFGHDAAGDGKTKAEGLIKSAARATERSRVWTRSACCYGDDLTNDEAAAGGTRASLACS